MRDFLRDQQVSLLFTNHTFSGLILRPPGTSLNGPAPDEQRLRQLGDQMASGAQVGGQHRRVRVQPRAVGLHRHAVTVEIQRLDPLGGTHLDAQSLEVGAQRRPEDGVVVVDRDVEQQTLGRPQEVAVEHPDQLARRELLRSGEEAAGEHLERQVSRRFGKVDVT